MKERDFLTVSELNAYLNNVLENDHLLWNVVIKGEISNVSLHRNNLYCTLKDKYSQISLLFFNYKERTLLKEGDNIFAEGQISYYVKTGKVTLVAKEIEICGLGIQFEKFLFLKEKLEKEGLFNEIHKINPPILPLNVCVITSKAGSVIEDIYSTIRKNNEYINVSVYDVSVQGQFAIEDITKGLKKTDALNYDLIVLARGGGSFEDLDAFNSEKVVRQIFDTKTFIISAVGHETDFTLSDAAADLRCLTPTAAANYILTLFNNTILKVQDLLFNISRTTEKKLKIIRNKLFSSIKNIQHQVDVKTIKTDALLKQFSTRIYLQNPSTILKKGYFRISSNGKTIKSVAHFSPNDLIDISSFDGVAQATINHINLKNGENK